MKVRLTPQARAQIETLISLRYQGTGFLLGHCVGGYLLIEGAWMLRFSAKSFLEVYETMCQKWGSRLKGVVFANCKVWLHRGIVEDVVLQIQGQCKRFFHIRFNNGRRQPVLVEMEEG